MMGNGDKYILMIQQIQAIKKLQEQKILKECLNLINTKIEVKAEDKNLTQNLREWRKDRNITKHSYIDFVENILEELLEPLYDKQTILKFKKDMIKKYFPKETWIQRCVFL